MEVHQDAHYHLHIELIFATGYTTGSVLEQYGLHWKVSRFSLYRERGTRSTRVLPWPFQMYRE